MPDMKDAFVNGLSAMYNTEKIILQNGPQMLQAVQNPQLKQAMEQHAQETQQQQQRLEQIFQKLGQTPNDITPHGIEGIMQENAEIQKQGYDGPVMDAALLAAAQRVEHYEIAGYGTIATYAEQIGNSQAAEMLGQTLQEEKHADAKLTQIAEGMVNPQAAQKS